MKNRILPLWFSWIIGAIAFDCSNSNGQLYINPNDYRSFYTCDGQCSSLNYCDSPSAYFSSSIQNCTSNPDNWIPQYYLSGTGQLPSNEGGATIYVLQDGYQLLWTSDDSGASHTFTGRYINETQVLGIFLRRVLSSNCINVYNVQLTATADRQYCATHTLHPQSAICDLVAPFYYSYCRVLSF